MTSYFRILSCLANTFAAICSWTYNLGTGVPTNDEAADEKLKWEFSNGKRLRGLMLRRTDERTLFIASIDDGKSKLEATT